jgi:hypothetical protein
MVRNTSPDLKNHRYIVLNKKLLLTIWLTVASCIPDNIVCAQIHTYIGLSPTITYSIPVRTSQGNLHVVSSPKVNFTNVGLGVLIKKNNFLFDSRFQIGYYEQKNVIQYKPNSSIQSEVSTYYSTTLASLAGGCTLVSTKRYAFSILGLIACNASTYDGYGVGSSTTNFAGVVARRYTVDSSRSNYNYLKLAIRLGGTYKINKGELGISLDMILGSFHLAKSHFTIDVNGEISRAVIDKRVLMANLMFYFVPVTIGKNWPVFNKSVYKKKLSADRYPVPG